MLATTVPAAIDSLGERLTAIAPKGHAVPAPYRFLRALDRLGREDRRLVVSLLGQEVAAPAATGRPITRSRADHQDRVLSAAVHRAHYT